MPAPRQNRTVTLFFAILRATRILIGLATLAAIVLLVMWWLGRPGTG